MSDRYLESIAAGGAGTPLLANRELLDVLPAAAYLCDANGLIVHYNQNAVRLWGRAPRLGDSSDRYCGSFKLFMLDGTPVEHADCWMAKTLVEGKPFQERQVVVERPDGTRRFVLAHCSPIFDVAGRVAGGVNILVDLTEQKRTEARLRAGQEHLVASQRIAHVGSWEYQFAVDPEDPNPLRWSDETYRLFGYAPGEVPATLETFRNRVHPDDRQRIQDIFRRARDADTVYESEHRIVLDDGTERIVSERAEVVHDPLTGAPLKFVGTAQDVTERRRAEAALIGRKRILEELATGAPLASILDRIVRLVEVQMPGALCSVLLLDDEERLRCGAGGSLPEEYFRAVDGVPIGPRVGSCGTAAWFGETVVSADIDADPLWETVRELTKAHGLRSCWSVPIVSSIGGGGAQRRVLGTFGVYRRIPSEPSGEELQIVGGAAHLAGIAIERITAEQALRQSEARSRAIVDALPDMMFRLDAEGRIFDFHASSRENLYTRPEDFLGKLVDEVLPPDTSALIRDHLKKALETLRPQTFEYELNVPGVGLGSYEARMVLCGERETITIVRDVTEKKRLEEQLRRSQKLEAVGRLAGGVAHDFNNLLTVVNGYSQILLAKLGADDPAFDGLSAIREAGQRAASLVKQLLAFSRGQNMQPVELDLNSVVAELRPFAVRLLPPNVELRLDCLANLPTVKVDRTQIEHVILNLIMNARDALPAGGRIVVSTSEVDAPECGAESFGEAPQGRFVQLSVADDGVGMSDETKAMIFEPFFTTKDVGKGTGLGLPMVHGIVKQSGGHIEVRSEIGVGTTMIVLLPTAATADRREKLT